MEGGGAFPLCSCCIHECLPPSLHHWRPRLLMKVLPKAPSHKDLVGTILKWRPQRFWTPPIRVRYLRLSPHHRCTASAPVQKNFTGEIVCYYYISKSLEKLEINGLHITTTLLTLCPSNQLVQIEHKSENRPSNWKYWYFRIGSLCSLKPVFYSKSDT